jgi:hypothetical protein
VLSSSWAGTALERTRKRCVCIVRTMPRTPMTAKWCTVTSAPLWRARCVRMCACAHPHEWVQRAAGPVAAAVALQLVQLADEQWAGGSCRSVHRTTVLEGSAALMQHRVHPFSRVPQLVSLWWEAGVIRSTSSAAPHEPAHGGRTHAAARWLRASQRSFHVFAHLVHL